MLAVACAPNVALGFLFMALVGFFSIWLIALANTLVQLQPEPNMRGRVMGLWTTTSPDDVRAGVVVGAVTQLVFGLREGFGLAGIALAAAAVLSWHALGAHDEGSRVYRSRLLGEERVDLPGQVGDLFGQLLVLLREVGVRSGVARELVGFGLRGAPTRAWLLVDALAVELVAVGLPRLGEQDQPRRRGGRG